MWSETFFSYHFFISGSQSAKRSLTDNLPSFLVWVFLIWGHSTKHSTKEWSMCFKVQLNVWNVLSHRLVYSQLLYAIQCPQSSHSLLLGICMHATVQGKPLLLLEQHPVSHSLQVLWFVICSRVYGYKPVTCPCHVSLPCVPAMWPCHVPLPCAPAMCPCHVPLPCVPAMCPCHVPLPCVPAMCPCHVSLPCVPAMCPYHVSLPCAPAMSIGPRSFEIWSSEYSSYHTDSLLCEYGGSGHLV